MEYFDGCSGQQWPPMLSKIKSAMSSVPPTSVEVERAFSAAGLFCTNIRTSLKDDMVETLCFFRAHFVNKVDTEW